MDEQTKIGRMLVRPSLKQFVTHIWCAFFIVFSIPWLWALGYLVKPILNEVLPVSLSNREQRKTVVYKGFKYQIVYLGGERFKFPDNDNFKYDGGFFKSDKENNHMFIRLFWPDIALDGSIRETFLKDKNVSPSHHYFQTRIYLQLQGESQPVEFNSNTFWQRHLELKQSEYTGQDDFKNELRVFTLKNHPEKKCSYSLDRNNYAEFCGVFSFYYSPSVRVSIGGYGWPDVKDTQGNPPKWQDIRQGIVAVLDRYHEVGHHDRY
jgi:hypothetical protein